METTHTLPASLEEVLVKQFRAFQELKTLTQEERKALFDNDAEALIPILENKERFVDDVGRLEKSLTELVENWAEKNNIPNQKANVSLIIRDLSTDWQQRISRLQQGVHALLEEVRELNSGNMALVKTAMERSEATREFLISLYQSSMESYGPTEQANPESFTFSELDTKA